MLPVLPVLPVLIDIENIHPSCKDLPRNARKVTLPAVERVYPSRKRYSRYSRSFQEKRRQDAASYPGSELQGLTHPDIEKTSRFSTRL
ncbi:MAG: hypothetical protein LBU06_08245 [Desulfovibrio sp.]|nr:hypothetical protein [Desulfovibrio sp.]